MAKVHITRPHIMWDMGFIDSDDHKGKKRPSEKQCFHKTREWWSLWIKNGLGRIVWEEVLSQMYFLRTKKLCVMGWFIGKVSMRNKSYAQNTKGRTCCMTLQTQETSPWIKCIKQSRVCHEWNASCTVGCVTAFIQNQENVQSNPSLLASPNLKWHPKVTYNAIEIQRHWGCCAFFHTCRNLTTVISNCSFVVNLKEAVNIDMVLVLCTQLILGKTVSKQTTKKYRQRMTVGKKRISLFPGWVLLSLSTAELSALKLYAHKQ